MAVHRAGIGLLPDHVSMTREFAPCPGGAGIGVATMLIKPWKRQPTRKSHVRARAVGEDSAGSGDRSRQPSNQAEEENGVGPRARVPRAVLARVVEHVAQG